MRRAAMCGGLVGIVVLLGTGTAGAAEIKAQMLLFLVSGRADALSGRFIHVKDDEEALVRRTDEIRQDNLHVLTVRT